MFQTLGFYLVYQGSWSFHEQLPLFQHFSEHSLGLRWSRLCWSVWVMELEALRLQHEPTVKGSCEKTPIGGKVLVALPSFIQHGDLQSPELDERGVQNLQSSRTAHKFVAHQLNQNIIQLKFPRESITRALPCPMLSLGVMLQSLSQNIDRACSLTLPFPYVCLT